VWTRSQGGYPLAMFTAPAYPVRMWLKHYQYRNPEQIERRLSTRRPSMEASTGFLHEVTPNWSIAIATKRDAPLDFKDADPKFAGPSWKERIVPAASLDYDAFDDRYVINERLMPPFPVRVPRSQHLKAVIPQPIRARLGRLRRAAAAKRWVRLKFWTPVRKESSRPSHLAEKTSAEIARYSQ
jgi:hypothetical protein